MEFPYRIYDSKKRCMSKDKPKKINLIGNTTHYQHARGNGMTNDRKENINHMNFEQFTQIPGINRTNNEKSQFME